MNEPVSLDPAALERLQRLGGGKFVIEMFDLFMSYVGQKVADACQACEEGNLEQVARAVHPIKSSAGNVGARRIQELATRIEQLANEGNSDSVRSQLAELKESFDQILPQMEAEKARVSES